MEDGISLGLRRFSYALDCFLLIVIGANCEFLVSCLAFSENQSFQAMDFGFSLMKLIVLGGILGLKKSGVINTQVVAITFANLFGLYLMVMGLVWQKRIFLFCSEVFRMIFIYLVRVLFVANNKFCFVVHSYSVLVWHILCFWFGKFDGVEDRLSLFLLVASCLGIELYNDYKMHVSVLKLRATIRRSIKHKQQIQNIFDSIPEIVFVVGEHLNILLHNHAAHQVLSMKADGFLYDVNLLQVDGSLISLALRVQELTTTGTLVSPKLGKSIIGDNTYEWKVSLTMWDGQPAATLLIQDVTALIQFEHSKYDAQLRNVMLRSISHELKTPANAFSNLLESALKCTNLPKKAERLLELAHDNCQHILHVIDDLLDFSKFMCGTFSLVKRRFNVRKILNDSFKPYKYMIKAAGLKADLTVDPELPIYGLSDSSRISQVIMNLINNACKFTRHGRITLMASLVATNSIEVSVSDTGVGILKEQQVNLRKFFWKLKENQCLNPRGIGLGLHISNLLAIQLGGEVLQVASEYGKGSTFSFTVNLNDESYISTDFSPELEEDKEPVVLPMFDFSVKRAFSRVLVVDDNVFNREIIASILHDIGVDCYSTSSGLEAIQAIINQVPFGLMFLDYEMPDLNGPQTARLLMQKKLAGEISVLPVIVAYTAYSSEQDRLECKEAGMQEFVTKPCAASEVRRLVAKYC